MDPTGAGRPPRSSAPPPTREAPASTSGTSSDATGRRSPRNPGLLAALPPKEPSSEGGNRPRAVIGVMGGMGAAAANQFGSLLIKLKTDAKSDQEHARVLLDQATDIPDRTAALNSGGPSPVPNMEASLKRLDAAGADLVAVTCNTAHGFIDDMQAAIGKFGLKLELLHIASATIDELVRQKPEAKRIGLLATSGTVDSKLYENHAEKMGKEFEWVYPSEDSQASKVMAGIYEHVKAGDLAGGQKLLLEAAQELRNNGADAILLACTEIPLVLQTGDVQDASGGDLPMIDTLASLAKAALDRAETKESRLVTPVGTFTAQPAGAESAGLAQAAQEATTTEAGQRRRIGVMGGMGPAAAMQFSEYMVTFNEAARKDQDHIPMMVDQATDIPDRTKAILSGGTNPGEEMGKSLRRLVAAGAHEIVMTCNTAHHFAGEMQKIIDDENLGVNIIHIVDATMKLLDVQAPNAEKVGLLATSGTVTTGIYQSKAVDRQWLVPDEATQEDQVMSGIYEGVKANDFEGGAAKLKQAAQELADAGADAILLACTEIPLVLRTGDIKNREGKVIPLIDTLEAQAREAIERSNAPLAATAGTVAEVAAGLRAEHQRALEQSEQSGLS
jgi:aspartate racemase